MDHRKGRVLCRDETSNLCHDTHQCDRTNVRALAAHVASGDYLKTILQSGINIIGDEGFMMNLLTNGMTTCLDCKRVCELRLDVAMRCDKVGERGNHVQHGNTLADFEERVDLRSNVVNKILDASIAHVDDFIVCVSNLLVELDQLQSLTFKHVLATESVDKDCW